MLPGIHALVDLHRTKDGSQLLKLKADCMDETVTFEVGDSVFEHCDSIIRATKVYRSKGFYKAEYLVLDAPSMSFSVSYADPEEDFSASGDVPSDIHKGISALITYLEGLRGGRKAVGHLDVRRLVPGDSTFMNTVWTNGYIEYIPESSGIGELLEHLCKKKEIAYAEHEWICELAEGSGFSCLIVENRMQDVMEVFNDKKTVGHEIQEAIDVKGKWLITSRRALTTVDLQNYETDTLRLMMDEITDHRYSHSLSDLELQNMRLISAETAWRKAHAPKP